LINGNVKLNFLYVTTPETSVEKIVEEIKGVRVPLMRNKKEKFNKMFIEYETLKEIIDSQKL